MSKLSILGLDTPGKRGLVCSLGRCSIEIALSVFRNKTLFPTELLVSYHPVFNFCWNRIPWLKPTTIMFSDLIKLHRLPIVHVKFRLFSKMGEGTIVFEGGGKGRNHHQLALLIWCIWWKWRRVRGWLILWTKVVTTNFKICISKHFSSLRQGRTFGLSFALWLLEFRISLSCWEWTLNCKLEHYS